MQEYFFLDYSTSRNIFTQIFSPLNFFGSYVLGIRSPEINPGTTCKFIPPSWYKGGRGVAGVDGTPPQSFGYVAVFQNDFAYKWKAYDLLICDINVYYYHE